MVSKNAFYTFSNNSFDVKRCYLQTFHQENYYNTSRRGLYFEKKKKKKYLNFLQCLPVIWIFLHSTYKNNPVVKFIIQNWWIQRQILNALVAFIEQFSHITSFRLEVSCYLYTLLFIIEVINFKTHFVRLINYFSIAGTSLWQMRLSLFRLQTERMVHRSEVIRH